MRIEYNFGLQNVQIPRFSVEATEGPDKLFTLGTLVLNVLYERPRVDVVFHSPNPDEPGRKMEMLKTILSCAPGAPAITYDDGESGRLAGVYFSWVSILTSGDSD
jgi:hypothetical protein